MESIEQNQTEQQKQHYDCIEDDPEYDLFGIEQMFTDTDYKLIDFHFEENPDYDLQLYALNAASTDIDRTGQVVWQAAKIFSEWILHKESIDDSNSTLAIGE